MYLVKLKSGLYSPTDQESQDASRNIPVGSEVKATVARNVKFHRKAMALLNIGFENQDRYHSFEVYRKVITIRAGYFEMGEVSDNEIPIAESLSFTSMSSERFEKWFNATLDVISSDMQTAPEKIKREIEGFY
jgi:hypothetical protein